MEHINTLQTYRNFLAAGFTEQQAESQVNVLNDSLHHLATKEDFKNLEKSTKDDIKNLEKYLKREIGHLRWLMIGIGSICALPVLQKLLSISF